MSLGFNEPSGCLGGCLSLTGLGITGLFSLSLFGLAVNDEDEPVMAVVALAVFIAIGLVFLTFGLLQLRKSRRLKAYVNLIRFQGHWSLDKIATLTSARDVDQVMREVQALVSGGSLYGYRVDPAKRTVTVYDPATAAGPAKPRLVKFTCPDCGAKNRFETVSLEVRCEFCGTPWVD